MAVDVVEQLKNTKEEKELSNDSVEVDSSGDDSEKEAAGKVSPDETAEVTLDSDTRKTGAVEKVEEQEASKGCGTSFFLSIFPMFTCYCFATVFLLVWILKKSKKLLF